ncbi:TlpA family protein disulfide reductase [Chitinimonas naiadis]
MKIPSLLLLLLGASLIGASLPGLAASKPAPARLDFTLPEVVSQQSYTLSALDARPTVVNFWTNGCAPCREELKWLSKLALAHPEVRFVGVAMDDRTAVLQFLTDNPLSFTNLLAPADPRSILRQFGNGIVAMPFTAILNADRSRCWANLGELDRAGFNKAFDYCALGHRNAP